MKFYNREVEIRTLHEALEKAKHSAQMTFIMGRRRTGKTTLILKAYQENFVYLFVSKKSEPLEKIKELQKKVNLGRSILPKVEGIGSGGSHLLAIAV